MSRTLTPPTDDSKMWRKLLKVSHPDAGGDHSLFIWTMEVRDQVCNAQAQPSARVEAKTHRRAERKREKPDRVPYTLNNAEFHIATSAARRYAKTHVNIYAELLQNLEDCFPTYNAVMWREQERGASYKRLAAIGHLVGMDKAERVGWYRVAESIPLSDRHAGHILSKLKGRRAAA